MQIKIINPSTSFVGVKSTSSLSISGESTTHSLLVNKVSSFQLGNYVKVVDATDLNNWFLGTITQLSGLQFVIQVHKLSSELVTGSDWRILLAGEGGGSGSPINGLQPGDIPIMIGSVDYNISEPGTYIHCLDSLGNPIVVTQGTESVPGDLLKGLVQLQGYNGVFKKVIVSPDFTTYSKKYESFGFLSAEDGLVTIDYNSTTRELTVAHTLTNKLFVVVGGQYRVVIPAVTAFQSTQTPSFHGGVNYLVYSISDQKLYGVNYTKIADYRSSNYIFVDTFYSLSPDTIAINKGLFSINSRFKGIIGFDKIANILGGPGYSLNYDTVSKQLTVSGFSWVVVGGVYYAINAGTTDLVDSRLVNRGTGINYLVYKVSEAKMYVYSFNDNLLVQNRNFISLGSFYNSDSGSIGSSQVLCSNFTINSGLKTYPSNREWNKKNSIVGSSSHQINYNTTSKEITVSGECYVVVGPTYYLVTPGITMLVDPNGTPGAGLNYIVFKLSDSKLYVYNYRERTLVQNDGFVFVGTFFGTDSNSILTSEISSSKFSINGTKKNNPYITEDLHSRLGGIVSQSGGYKINIDLTDKTVTFSSSAGQCYIVLGAEYYARPTVNLSEAIQIVGTTYAGIFFLYYQKSVAKIRCFHYSKRADAQNNDHILLAWFYDLDSNSYKNTVTLCKEICFNNVKVNNFPDPVLPTGEIIAPAKIWMMTGEKLPIYKSSMCRTVLEQSDEFALLNLSETGTDWGYPTVESFVNEKVLNPADLKSAIKIVSKKYSDTAKDFVADITVNKVNPASKSGMSKNWWCIGDSLTNRGVANYTKSYLSGFGITLNCFGTITNTGQLGEGREGWTFLNFIGADNVHLNATPITRLADGATTSTLYQNPFLRLATSDDYTNHPTWCFRNTGSNVELSYQADPDKTGNFYIFDPLYYSAQHLTGNVPDVITIALGTNDISEFAAQGVVNSLFGLEVMLRQIKTAYPTVKVGVVPATVKGDNSTNWSLTCDFINQVNLKLTALALSGVETIGVWIHQNRHFSFPYTGSANLQADGNLTKSYTKGDAIHFTRDGYLPYARALGAYICNVI